MKLEDLNNAKAILNRYFPPSRLIFAASISEMCHREIFLKLETDIPTGSFKPRGAIYSLTQHLAMKSVDEIVTSSTGNHGIAVAYAGKLFGIRTTVVLPLCANASKRKQILGLGAQVVDFGTHPLEAANLASSVASERRALLLSDAEDPYISTGLGTIALEIIERNPRVQAIFVPIGDGALVRGLVEALGLTAPEVKVIGVQAANSPTYFDAWAGNAPSMDSTETTIAEGLIAQRADASVVELLRNSLSDMHLVSETELLVSMRHLLLKEHTVAEPSGAAAVAAILKAGQLCWDTVVAVVTGANVSEELLMQALRLPSQEETII